MPKLTLDEGIWNYTLLCLCVSTALTGTVTIVATASSLAFLLVVVSVITIIVAVMWCHRQWKRRGEDQEQKEEEEEEGGEYNMVLAHDVNTTTHQSTGTVPNPAYSNMQILGSGNDLSDDVTLSQLQVKAEQNNSLHSSYTALSLDTLQVQPYTKLNICNNEGEVAKVEGDSGVRAYKELDLKSLEVHLYTPLDVSTMEPVEKEEEESYI